MKEIILFGGGGHCHAVVELIRHCGGYTITEILDKNPKKTAILGIPVSVREDNSTPEIENAAITIGNNNIRKKIAENFKSTNWPSFIHSTAVVYPSVRLGRGVQVLPLSVLDAEVSIGDFCIINNSATISHHVTVGDYCHVAINVSISGDCTIGEGALLGAGCTILPGITIGKWAAVGAGAVVVKDVPDGATVVGNPARILK